ncbi:MAG: hypothetical protein ACMX3H_20010 [Sodalis sp. (in: enterobacteria)]|uniref:hypothetical protein n=1 Tax=Sodalis sp. (in: enterobacteria) TaxID=1898979 RepID=UPI0039E23E0A
MIEVENVKVLLLEATDLVFRLNKDGSDTIILKPEADKKATLAEIVIFGDRLIKNRHAL